VAERLGNPCRATSRHAWLGFIIVSWCRSLQTSDSVCQSDLQCMRISVWFF